MYLLLILPNYKSGRTENVYKTFFVALRRRYGERLPFGEKQAKRTAKIDMWVVYKDFPDKVSNRTMIDMIL